MKRFGASNGTKQHFSQPDPFFPPLTWRRLGAHDVILSSRPWYVPAGPAAAFFFPVLASPDPSPGVDEEHSAEPVRKLLSPERRRTVNASKARHGHGGGGGEEAMTGKFEK